MDTEAASWPSRRGQARACLSNRLGQHGGVRMISVASGENQCDMLLVRAPDQFIEQRSAGRLLELLPILLSERLPLLDLVAVPFPERGRRRDVAHPLGDLQ